MKNFFSSTGYALFGFPMYRRAARRKLVVITYSVLLPLCALTIGFARNPGAFGWCIYATMAVAFFIFGGTGRRGLVKPFLNQPPRPDAPVIDLVRLHLQPLSVGTPDPDTWRNDERELHRRDFAHYRAFQPLSLAPMIITLLLSFALHPVHVLSTTALLIASFSVGLVATVLSMTLPAAIILWTEPDLPHPID